MQRRAPPHGIPIGLTVTEEFLVERDGQVSHHDIVGIINTPLAIPRKVFASGLKEDDVVGETPDPKKRDCQL